MYTDHFIIHIQCIYTVGIAVYKGESPPPGHSYFKSKRLIKITYFFQDLNCVYYRNKTPLSLKAGTPGPVIVSS